MSTDYRVLPLVPMQLGASYVMPRQVPSARVTMDSPALEVMTDFSVVTAYTIRPLETIEVARTRMIQHTVRSLIVINEQDHVLGIITSFDLSSERPMKVIQTQGIRHSDVLVKDIMTPRERLEVICVADLEKSRVGDLVATLQANGRAHTLIVDRKSDQSQVLRGMVSAHQISRQLGTAIHTMPVARSFAELGEQLS